MDFQPHAAPEHNAAPEASPAPWVEFRKRAHRKWVLPFLYIDWLSAHAAWYLSRWSLLRVLAYAETFSVLIALIFWIAEAGERRQQKHYQAWQVINTAQGKGGSGGRGEALQQLSADGVPLVGVDLSDAFLQDVRLDGAQLRRSSFRAADVRNAHFRNAMLADSNMTFANLRGADLRDADLRDAILTDADLTGADLQRAALSRAVLDRADLRGVNLQDTKEWNHISSMQLADIAGVRNPPEGFVAWAIAHGAVQTADSDQWTKILGASATKPWAQGSPPK